MDQPGDDALIGWILRQIRLVESGGLGVISGHEGLVCLARRVMRGQRTTDGEQILRREEKDGKGKQCRNAMSVCCRKASVPSIPLHALMTQILSLDYDQKRCDGNDRNPL